MFLYQSETDTHFECPSCGQRGSVATHLLDNALRDNAHVQISCTGCKQKFEPHAPASETLQALESNPKNTDKVPDDIRRNPRPDEDHNMPAQNAGSTFDEASALPDLHEVWRQHDDDKTEDETDDNAAPRQNFPSWMHRKRTDPIIDVTGAEPVGADENNQAVKEIDPFADAALIDDALEDEHDDTKVENLPQHSEADEAESDTNPPMEVLSDRPLSTEDEAVAAAIGSFAAPEISDQSPEGDNAPETDVPVDTPDTSETEEFFDDEVTIGSSSRLSEGSEQHEDAQQADLGDLTAAKKPGFFAAIIDRIRRLFQRHKIETVEEETAPLTSDDDGMRVFGGDDFIDDAAFAEAQRLNAVENEMRAASPLMPAMAEPAIADNMPDGGSELPPAQPETATDMPNESRADNDAPTAIDLPEVEGHPISGPTNSQDQDEDRREERNEDQGNAPPMREFGDDIWEPFPEAERHLETSSDMGQAGTALATAPTHITPQAASATNAPKKLTALGLANLLLAFVLIVLTALNTYVLLSDKPQFNPLVDATPLVGAAIQLESAGFELLPDPEGDSLIVSAVFKNAGEQAGLIDDYIIYLQNAERQSLTSWTVVSGGETIEPGRSRSFSSTLFAPPPGVAHIAIEYPVTD